MGLTQRELESMSDFELNLIATNMVKHSQLDARLCTDTMQNVDNYCTNWSLCNRLIAQLKSILGLTLCFKGFSLSYYHEGGCTTVKSSSTNRVVVIFYILAKQGMLK